MKPNYIKFNLETLGSNKKAFELAKPTNVDSIRNEDFLLLDRVRGLWDSLSDFRTRRQRARNYYRGDQWGDEVWDPETCTYVTEEDYIKSQGKVPLKQNQIRPNVKNLIGQYIEDSTKPAVVARKRVDASISEMLTNTLQYGLAINDAKQKDTRSIEEFLLSGAVVQKILYKYNKRIQLEEVKLTNVSVPHMFFTSNVMNSDDDIKIIGQFHDLAVKDIIAAFAGNSTKRAAEIEQIYKSVLNPKHNGTFTSDALSSYFVDNLDFYISTEPDKGRVFEIWEEIYEWRLRCHDMQKAEVFVTPLKNKGLIDQENKARFKMAYDQFAQVMPQLTPEELTQYTKERVPLIEYRKSYESFWWVKYLSPFGHLLHEMETPYAHKSHPYSVLLYPLVDGEVWGFVEDIIDQQRYINRLVTLLDFIIGSSAKGVLLVSEDAIPDDMNINDFADSWSKFNGVLKIKTKNGVQIPYQISANSSNVGIHELLNLQLKFLSEISGVSGSIQGQDGKNKSGKLYAQETQNSTLNSKDYFETFNNFKRKRDWKLLTTQIQYYKDKRHLALNGSNMNPESLVYDPDRTRDIKFEMVMAKSPDSPIYRAIIEENLKEFLAGQYISFETYLKNTSLPFADNLLIDLQKNQEQIGSEGAENPALLNGIGDALQAQGADPNKANPQAMQLINQYAGG